MVKFAGLTLNLIVWNEFERLGGVTREGQRGAVRMTK